MPEGLDFRRGIVRASKLSVVSLVLSVLLFVPVAEGAEGLARDEQGWTVFAPTPLDESKHPRSDPRQPGTRLIYVSKLASPVVPWAAGARYSDGDVGGAKRDAPPRPLRSRRIR